jgi:hypothetical protein
MYKVMLKETGKIKGVVLSITWRVKRQFERVEELE